MDNKKNRLFIHKDMEYVTLEQSVEIVLTPQFYTFIREELDIRFTYQAKQIAASLFDDYLEESDEWQYHVTKCQSYWCFFAYDIHEIERFLESIGITRERISKIYFAQELHAQLEEPVQLSEKNILKSVDGIVTLIPTRLIENNTFVKPLDLSEVKLSSGISMGASLNSFISLKQSIVLSSLFILLGVVNLTEGSRIKSSIEKDDERLIELLAENSRYSSSAVRQSLIKKYEPIDQKERLKRQTIKDISKLLSANSQLLTLKIEKSKIQASIKTNNANTSKQVLQSAKAKKFKSTSNALNINVEKEL